MSSDASFLETDEDEHSDELEQSIPQWSLFRIVVTWLVVVLPMAALVFIAVPMAIQHRPDLNPGLIFWGGIILGMAWQTVVSLCILFAEGPEKTWSELRKALWLSKPIDPITRRAAVWSLWLLVPLGGLLALMVGPAFGWMDDWWAGLLPEWLVPAYGDIRLLAVPQNEGNWAILWIALVSSLFNYVLGEALFFHCILLPRMQGAFGRWAWAANGLAFGLYHIHKVWKIPTIILTCLCYSFPAQITRSAWPALPIHGIEGIWLILAVLLIICGV